jgi:hypothetical protein
MSLSLERHFFLVWQWTEHARLGKIDVYGRITIHCSEMISHGIARIPRSVRKPEKKDNVIGGRIHHCRYHKQKGKNVRQAGFPDGHPL